MSGLEFLFRKTLSNTSDIKKHSGPTCFSEAFDELSNFAEKQLPLQIETEFSPISFDITKDESTAVIGGTMGNLATFDFETKKIIRDEDSVSKTAVIYVTFAAEDKQIIVLNAKKELFFCNFPEYSVAHKLELKNAPTSIRVRPGKDLLYISNSGPDICIVQIDKNEEAEERSYKKRMVSFGGVIRCMDISDDGNLLALSFEEGVIKIVHTDTEMVLQSTVKNDSFANILCFSENRRHLAAGFIDNSIRVWNIDSSLTLKNVFEHHCLPITGLSFVKNNRYLISGSEDKDIVVWDMKVERKPYIMNFINKKVVWFKTSSDHNSLYFSQSELLRFMIWEVPQLIKNARYRKHSGTVNKLCFVPNSFEIISVGSDGLFVIWDYRNDLIQHELELDGELNNIVISKTGDYVLVLSSDPHCIYKVSLSDYTWNVTKLNDPAIALRFSNDESLFAISDQFNKVIIYDNDIFDKKSPNLKGHTKPVSEVYFVNENEFVITASLDGTLGKWDLASGNRLLTFIGHKSGIISMIVSKDYWVISASDDHSIMIWNINGILLYTINLKDHGEVKSLYLSDDNMYMLVLQEKFLSFWQMYNLSLMFELDTDYQANSMTITKDEKIIAIAEGNTIFIDENPLKSKTLRISGKTLGSMHSFLKFVIDVKNNIKTSLDIDDFHWVFTPYLISAPHILAHSNRINDLNEALTSKVNRAPFFSTINNESPLSISVDRAYKNCIDVCLKYIRKNSKVNDRAYVPIESCLTKLNTVDIPGIVKLYDIIFKKSTYHHLPSFCLHETPLPSLYLSDQLVVFPENIVPKDFISTNGRTVVFYQSQCPLDLDPGTEGSIEFLQSLLECTSDQIFRSKILQVLLLHKWDQVKWAVYAQGMLYILYMVLLSFFCVMFPEDPTFLIFLFIVHVFLFFYEVTQIATDFFDYWGDLWNILDQLRGLTFTVYAVLLWRGENNMDVLLSVIIFSWIRGISYFRMFDGTRYMVRLLSEVIKDMREFFVMLFYSTLAFSFIYLLRNPTWSFSKCLTVSYRLDLGDFEADYSEIIDWVIFFLATVIDPLIMLNLLISIMGDTYAKVQESNDIANFQELTEMIIEIEKLMFWKKKLNHKHFLQQCDFVSSEESGNDKIIEKLRYLKTHLGEMEENMAIIKDKIKNSSTLELEGNIFEIKQEQNNMKNELKQALEKNTELLETISKGFKTS